MKRPRVLLCDDFPDFREMKEVDFRGAPFDCDFASSGEEMLRLVKSGGYDLIISDLAMTPVGGWEALEQIRRENPDLPLWAISAYTKRDMMNDVRAKQLNVLLLDKANDAAGLRERITDFFEAAEG